MENRGEWEAKENRSFGILYLASRRDAEDEGVQAVSTATNRKKLKVARRRSFDHKWG
jgi:hypothetical protein